MARKRYFIPAPQPSAWIRAVLVALLPAVLAMVWWHGQTYDPGLVSFNPTKKRPEFVSYLSEQLGDFERIGHVRTFVPDTLFEYVNGHDNYYINAGVQNVATAEYGTDGKPNMVVDFFHFEEPIHAFGVLMDEAGSSSERAEVGDVGFVGAKNAKFIAGPYYVRIRLFKDGLSMRAIANAVADVIEVETNNKLVFHFPKFGNQGETRFVKSGYRGMDLFKNVVEREFSVGGKKNKAFLINGIESEIEKLKSEVLQFLKDDEIPFSVVELSNNVPIYLVSDRYEGDWFFFTHKTRFTGGYWIWDDRTREVVVEDLSK